jgi:glycosyltransferase involved in cell wall biosynthesis
VLNTAYDGFSHVQLEAMMGGVPVVRTPTNGNSGFITDYEKLCVFSVQKKSSGR